MLHRSFRASAITSTALGFLLLASGVAHAQAVPNTVLPSTSERKSRIEVERPQVGGAPVIKESERVRKPTGGASFTLKGVRLEGATVYNSEDLKTLYADKLGKKITLGELSGLADDITSYYRNNGYILSRAVVPPQRAEGGVIAIKIVEGFVNDVKLEGDAVEKSSLIHDYANKIRNSKPLNATDLERYLLLMEDLPGVEARAVLRPAANTPGASDVVVTIKRRPVEFAASLDNRGGRYIGPLQASASLFLNNLIGQDELTQLRFSNSIFKSDELLFGEIRHIEPIGAEGTTVTLVANQTRTNPGDVLKDLEIKGDSGVLSAAVSHPVIRSRRNNWFVNGDFTARNVQVDTLGTSLYKDKTRVLTLGTAYDFVDSLSAINKLEANVGKGFNWGTSLKNGNVRSRANGETDFLKWTGKATRIQPLFGDFSLQASVGGQYSNDPLLASEEYTLGGPEFGSAYDSAELSGDSGIGTRAELQYNQTNVNEYIGQYQLYGFYDYGAVWNENVLASERPRQALSSGGAGVRFNALDAINGGLELAVPITHHVTALNNVGDEPRLFFNLQYRY